MNPKLRPCKACGNEITRDACTCPKCGQKHGPYINPTLNKIANRIAIASLVVIAFVTYVAATAPAKLPTRQQEVDTPAQAAMKDEANTRVRAVALEGVKKEGVITKIEQSGANWNAWVNHLYRTFDPEDQAKYAQRIYRAKCTGYPGCSVVIFDATSGKELARHSGEDGFKEAVDTKAIDAAQAVIEKATQAGIVYDVESAGDSIINAQVTDAFREMPLNQKCNLGRALHAVHCGTNTFSCFAVFIDAKTGKNLGRYSAYTNELTMDN